MSTDISIQRCLTIAVFIGLALGLIGALSGCASGNGGSMMEQHKRLSDGRTVTCLWENSHGAISCDWGHAK